VFSVQHHPDFQLKEIRNAEYDMNLIHRIKFRLRAAVLSFSALVVAMDENIQRKFPILCPELREAVALSVDTLVAGPDRLLAAL
jgi:hypothetical protein